MRAASSGSGSGRAAVALFAVLLGAGCGGPALPSPELVSARAALATAKQNPAAQLATDELVEAQLALDEAERAREEGGGSEARDLAYLAQRQAEQARIASMYRADLAALEEARARINRLHVNIARRAAAEHQFGAAAPVDREGGAR